MSVSRNRWLMKSIALGWRAVLSLPAVVFVIGCGQSPTSTDRVPIPQFSIAPGSGSWTTKAPMPSGRTYPSVGVVNGIIYAVGGEGNFTELTVNEAYDPTTNSWSSKAPAPTGVDQSAAGVLNGVLFVVSGSTGFACQGSYVGTNSAYDPATDTWTTKAPDPTPRCGAAAAATGGLLYVVGGAAGGVPTLEAYNPATDTWTTKAPIPTPRGLLAAAVMNGVLYVLGGDDNTGVLSTVEAYDPTTDAWTTKAPMPTARCCLAAEVVNGILYAVGGVDATGILNTVEGYDPLTNTWTTVASMPTARCCVGIGAVNGSLFALGGNSASTKHLTTNEAFAPPFNFTGFFQPVDNPPVVNSTKAGSAIPVKFSLHGNQGLAIFAPGYPGSQNQACSGGVTDAIEQTVTANANGLTYDPVSDQYTYVWKTSKSWSGTCRALSIGFTDGSIYQALFNFN